MVVAPAIELMKPLQDKDIQDAIDEMIRRTADRIVDKHGSGPIDAFRSLAVCRGGFTWDAALAITETDAGILRRLLSPLTDTTFVKRDASGRYSIEDLVRDALGEDESARARHLEWFRAFAYKMEHDRANVRRYVEMDVERENLDAAFDWGLRADPVAAVWLANNCSFYLANRGRWAQRLDWFTALESSLPDDADGYVRASLQNSIGNVFLDHPVGDSAVKLERSIAAYRHALRFWTPESVPYEYAMTQQNLGIAYENLAAVADKGANLELSIAAYTEALRFLLPESAPYSYSVCQNNMGNTYLSLAEVRDKEANLSLAIVAYREALHYTTPEFTPHQYARTQNNIAGAYRMMAAERNKRANLEMAIAAYQEVLRFFTPESSPGEYAMTQANLGNAYEDIAADRDWETDLDLAIAAHTEALRFFTPDSMPREYATTQASLGIALEKSGHQARAIACWREAETYFRVVGLNENADQMLRWIADAGG